MKKPTIVFAALLCLAVLPTGSNAQSAYTGSEIKVRLLDRLDTGETPAGRVFSASIEEPVRLDNKTVLTKGTTVKGSVVDVVSSGRLKKPASITLQLTGVGTTAIHTEPLQIDGKSHAGHDTALIGGGAAAGAIFGAIIGGGKGAAIGAVAGGGAGTGAAYATGKQEIVLPSETELTFLIAGNAGGSAQPSAANTKNAASYSWRDNTAQTQPTEVDEQDAYDDSRDGDANVNIGISIGPPPSSRVAYVAPPPPPAPEFVWVEGYWYPVGNHYKWHEGYWTRPPYASAHWVGPRWERGHYFVGYWDGPHGRFEHDHHWDHDHDRDFHDRDRDEHGNGHGNGHAYGHNK